MSRKKEKPIKFPGRDRDADMLKLADAFMNGLERDDCEWGAIGADCKRPFGNSDMPGDVCEIIGLEQTDDTYDESYDYAVSLYNALPDFLIAKWKELRGIQ